MKIAVDQVRIIFSEVNDPAEVLQVKRLPGRYFEDGRWMVPIFPGLTDYLDKRFGFIGIVILAVIEQREADLLQSIMAPPVTPRMLEEISAVEALNRAQEVRELQAEWKRKGEHK